MARLKHEISGQQLDVLRKKIKQVYPKPIKFAADCKELAQFIFLKTNRYISDTTLKRFFEFIPSKFSPSVDTIRILEHFIQISKNNQSSISADFVLSFYSLSHFENLPAGDTSFHAACRSIAMELRQNQQLFEQVMEPLAQSKMGQQFYYELFPDYSILSAFQYKGFEYFLEYAKYYEAQIYGRCMLFMKHFFESNKKGMEKQLTEILLRYRPSKKLHPFVRGRVYQSQLIFASFDKNHDKTKTLKELWKNERLISRVESGNFHEFPGFHYFCCDGLFHSKMWHDLLKMSNIALTEFERHKQFEWKGYYDQFKIYQAFALFELNQKKEAAKIHRQIKSEGFYFITKEYYQNLYTHLCALLKSENFS